jgi:hypothetical protein
MHAKRTQIALAASPAAAYVVLMLLVAALYVKPPLVGWIGLGVVAAAGAAVAAGAAFLFPRMRRNVAEETETVPGRILVLADARCDAEHLRNTLAAHAGADVHVVAPVLPSPVHYLSGDERREERDARRRLDATLAHLRRAGIPATGSLGADDPLQALGDALAAYGAADVLVVGQPETHWLEDGLVEDAARLFPHVRRIVMSPEIVHA